MPTRRRPAYPSDLTDAQWALVQAALPPAVGGRTGRPRTYSLREVWNAVFSLSRNGCTWRALPHDFPPWAAVWDHVRRWRDSGTLERGHAALREQVRVRAGRAPTPSLVVIDSQSDYSRRAGSNVRAPFAHPPQGAATLRRDRRPSRFPVHTSERDQFTPYPRRFVPVRKIPRSYRAVTGATASAKVGRAVASESTLERDVFTLLEFDPDVDRYDEQPVTVPYRDEAGDARRYTPDVLVWYREDVAPGCWRRPLLAEVKYRADLDGQWRALRRRLAAARTYAAAHGWEFRILTEREVRTPYLANARFLLPYRRRPRTEESSVRERLLLDALQDMREADAETLLLYVHRSETLRLALMPELWRLVGWRAIRADLRLPLTMRSRLWLASPAAAMPEHGRWLRW